MIHDESGQVVARGLIARHAVMGKRRVIRDYMRGISRTDDQIAHLQ